MLRKLSFILIIAILLSACGASAPEANASVELPGTAACSIDDAQENPVETVPAYGVLPESAEAQAVSQAEYFYFTNYSNTITNEDGQALLYENRCMPSFTSGDAQRSEWVGSILGDIERDFNTDSTNLHDYARDYVEEYGTELFYSYSNYQQLGVARHDEAVVSVIVVSSLYSGGSHPNSVQVAYNLDISNQRILSLEDVIVEEASASALAKLVREGVDSKFAAIDGGNGLFEDYGETIDNSMLYGNMTPYWYLNDTGLVVFYNQYELGPYAAGIIKVELPYDSLDGILQEEYFPAPGTGAPGNLVLRGEWEGYQRIPITLDEEEGVLLVGVEGTIYQVQISEIQWLEETPIAKDMRFSALSLGQNDVLEISGGYTDDTRSFVIEFIDGRGEHRIYYIQDGELTGEPNN